MERSINELVQAFRYNHVLHDRERARLHQLAEAIVSAAQQGWPEHCPNTTDDDLDL